MLSSDTSGQSVSNIGFNLGLSNMNDVLPTTRTDERTFNLVHNLATRVDNKEEVEINDDPIQESRHNGLKFTLFSELKVISTKLEGSNFDNEGPKNVGRIQSKFTMYEPPPYVLNVDIDTQNRLKIPELPHK